MADTPSASSGAWYDSLWGTVGSFLNNGLPKILDNSSGSNNANTAQVPPGGGTATTPVSAQLTTTLYIAGAVVLALVAYKLVK